MSVCVCTCTSPAVLTSHCPQYLPLSLVFLVTRELMAGGGGGGCGGAEQGSIVSTWQGDFS